jgi:KDO2-lipid IV(A) lauroyltransferase
VSAASLEAEHRMQTGEAPDSRGTREGAAAEGTARPARRNPLVRLARAIILYVTLRPLVLLPLRFQLAVGRAIGRLGARLAKRPKRIVRRNLELCFPERSPGEIDDLVRRHFESLGMSVVEMAFAWWASGSRLRACTRVTGLEHYERARAAGRSILLLSAHFAATELGGVVLGLNVPGMHAVYRSFDQNPLADALTREGRLRSLGGLVERDDVPGMLRVLRAKTPLWFASDHLVRADKRSVLIPFFGIPCVVHGAVLDLVRLSNACVIPVVPFRVEGARYVVEIGPPLENFPTGDRAADMSRIMGVIEEWIRRAPEQYTWVWKRFAKRPESYPDLYRF